MKANLLYPVTILLFSVLFSCGGEATQEATTDEIKQETTSIDSPSEEEKTHPTPAPSKEVMLEETVKNGSTKEAVAAIRAEYARLQKMLDAGTLRKEVKTFDCEGDPTEGELVRYYEGDDLVVMQHNQGGGHGWEGKQIYLKGGMPFFVLEEEGYWTFGGPLNEDETSNTIDYSTENRYYFQDGVLIRQLTKAFETHSWEKLPEGNEVPNEEVEIIADQSYLDVLSYIADLKKGVVGC
ncbi:hypothetical protein [Lewinella cohaerens]|uniref:hypothetical protein n=1 Tax=Lewinella cohaerens TaxID=70995 RepID=UPI00037CD589|nr:hypothetical protein [Lewinella cohaerens]